MCAVKYVFEPLTTKWNFAAALFISSADGRVPDASTALVFCFFTSRNDPVSRTQENGLGSRFPGLEFKVSGLGLECKDPSDTYFLRDEDNTPPKP